MEAERPYRIFDVELARRERLTPWLARLTFTGPDVTRMRTLAPDQRIKVFFPRPDGRPPGLPTRGEWYAIYRAEPEEVRAPIRTYTIRALRAEAAEVDIDFVLHGETGPASRWATHARPGDRVQIAAPNAAYEGDPGGYEWKPPAGAKHVLLIADETALPALAGILEELARTPSPPSVQAYVEAPTAQAGDDLPTWPGLELRLLARGHGEESRMLEAARRARLPPQPVLAEAGELQAVDVDRQILWDRADPVDDGFYAWVAGEASSVLAIRSFLVKERGLDRRALNLMGYWRRGVVLD